MKDSPLIFLFFIRLKAKITYPDITSKTCCQGLVEFGFLIFNILFCDHFVTQSGIILFGDQSPPPITFPALAIAIFTFLFLFRNDL